MKQVLEVKEVSKSYTTGLKALSNVSFTIHEGECLGLVGESGSGKSTLAKLILGLEQVEQGQILLNGEPFHTLKRAALKKARKHMQVVFQDPSASLNSKLPIWKTIVEPLENYPEVAPEFLSDIRNSKRSMAEKLLQMVGLNGEILDRYPHQLSGGQRQRVSIARGISLQPRLLICDEPTSNLDVSVQAQILNLLKKLKNELRMSYLYISHDIATVRFLSDRIIVLKEGQLVDHFAPGSLFSSERHKYTQELVLAAK